jgi:hypothetical protein
VFVHQLPPQPSKLRVNTWRRLQQIGAIALKGSVYVLPDTPNTREDFEWLKTEVKSAGGDATLFAAENLDAWADDELVEEFRRNRQDAYADVSREVEATLNRMSAARRPRRLDTPLHRLLDAFRQRLAAIEAVDFFAAAGRDRALAALKDLEDKMTTASPPKTDMATDSAAARTRFQGRLWVTRFRPGVDRMSSAWLIRRFIDPQAKFGFAADRESVPDGAVAFDMFGVEFSHQKNGCTFETLCTVFGLDDPVLSRIAAIVHDLDLKETRYGAPECSTVATMIEGLRLSYEDDHALLAQGMTFFESLYRSFEQSTRPTGPRAIAKHKGREARRAQRRTAKRR